tara:strand:+ start:1308 stop:2351 length:1044 start_codon:yes stop_codon:yes gene_type:complete
MRNETVAIIVPTKNRSQFIRRFLHFNLKNNSRNKIYIADSSDEGFHLEGIQEAIKEVSPELKVVYGHYPDCNIEEAKRRILDKVDETYSAFCGDDDFLIPSSIEKCADFLESNPNYSNCHGSGLVVRLDGDVSLSGQVSDIFTYDLLPNEWDTPKERLENFLKNYWSIWSVYRTEEYKHTLLLLKEIPVESFREMTMGCIPIIKGKTKLLDCLYVVRQDHDTRFESPELSQAFYHEGWYESYKKMESIVSALLSKEENIELKIAEGHFRDGFSYYYNSELRSELIEDKVSFFNRIKNKASRVLSSLMLHALKNPILRPIFFNFLSFNPSYRLESIKIINFLKEYKPL